LTQQLLLISDHLGSDLEIAEQPVLEEFPQAITADHQSGQSLLEYILIVGLVVFGAAQVSRRFIDTLDRVVLRVGADLERDLKSGRAPLGVWSN
jgi:hypothetical protein